MYTPNALHGSQLFALLFNGTKLLMFPQKYFKYKGVKE
jgi:hypothetical protein